MDLTPIITALVAALFAGGGVGLVTVYMARSNKESLNVKTSMDAVAVVSGTLTEQRIELKTTRDELKETRGVLAEARERIAVQERLLDEERAKVREAHEISVECRRRIAHLSEAIRRLGGTVDDVDNIEDRADA